MTDIEHFLDFEIGMLTTVIVGSSQTYLYEGYMVTPRGHQNKYDLENGQVKKGQRKTFSLRCEGDLQSQVNLKEEGLELAKTYQTPADSWVTPKDTHDTSFLKEETDGINHINLKTNSKPNSEESALKALSLLQDQGQLAFSTNSEKNKKKNLHQNQK